MIRILKATTYYPDFLEQEHRRGIFDQQIDYNRSYRKLMDRCYGWSDFWKKNLESIGNHSVMEVVLNAEHLQKKWASEHGLNPGSDWEYDIFMEQAREFRPDVIFMQTIYHHTRLLTDIRKKIPSVKFIIGWDGIMHHDLNTYADCDLVMTCYRDTLEYYAANGKRAEMFHFGFENSILDRISVPHRSIDVVMAGSMYLGNDYHLQRLELVSYLERNVGVELYAASFDYQWRYLSRQQIRRLIGFNFGLARDMNLIGRINHGPLFGLDMYEKLASSKITLNTHANNNQKQAGNMRLFEATGIGSCVITDWKENLSDYFEEDREIVTYRSKEEALSKIRYLLDNDSERNKISEAGQNRCLNNYSYHSRMKEFAKILNSCI